MTNSASAMPTWALRAHAVFDWVWWMAYVNALWWVFALAGGIVFGIVPSSTAAADLTRRRLRGEVFPVARSFAAAWRRDLRTSNLALGLGFLVTGMLAVGVAGQLAAGALGSVLGISTVVALAAAFVITAVSVPLYVHYELPLGAYLLMASRWAMRNVLHVVLLLLGAVAIAGVGSILPGVVPFLTVGAWLTLSTVLCMAFFAANDRALADRAPAASRSS
ncbi:YesL family protein [Microbacterium sp. ZW T2_14]|uniref:YesL family protein n=1 Tax=Microbacterium sp. ZW T2_14 TaxID=3378079 RepID=UPI0038553D86